MTGAAEIPANEAEVIVKAADMPEEMQQQVIAVSREAIEKYEQESDIASFIKKTIDTWDSPTWHCVVGISFGSLVAHSQGHFIHIKIKAPTVRGFKDLNIRSSEDAGFCYVLLFKTQ